MVTPEQRRELIELMNKTWEEEEEVVDALIRILGTAEAVKTALETDNHFNRYTYCDSWTELMQMILDDEAIELDEEEVAELEAISHSEAECKSYLVDQNWCLDKIAGFAIGFDDDVEVACHEIDYR